MYAIIATGGKQYKVSEGDVIDVEKIAAEANGNCHGAGQGQKGSRLQI